MMQRDDEIDEMTTRIETQLKAICPHLPPADRYDLAWQMARLELKYADRPVAARRGQRAR